MRLPQWSAACRRPSSAATTSCSCSGRHSSGSSRRGAAGSSQFSYAGIGESRLATELLSWVDGRAVTSVGRCLSYGEGITFWPLAEALRGLGEPLLRDALSGDDQRDTVLELLDGVTGVSETVSSEQIFWAVHAASRGYRASTSARRLLRGSSLGRADDAGSTSSTSSAGSVTRRYLVVAIARRELVEDRPHWTTPQPELTMRSRSGRSRRPRRNPLLADLSGDAPLPAEVRERIAAAAEGNPLFVEQISALAAEDSGRLTIPPSIRRSSPSGSTA